MTGAERRYHYQLKLEKKALEAELRGEATAEYTKERAAQKRLSDKEDARRDHRLERSLARWTPQRCSAWGGALASIVAVEAISGLAWLLFL